MTISQEHHLKIPTPRSTRKNTNYSIKTLFSIKLSKACPNLRVGSKKKNPFVMPKKVDAKKEKKLTKSKWLEMR